MRGIGRTTRGDHWAQGVAGSYPVAAKAGKGVPTRTNGEMRVCTHAARLPPVSSSRWSVVTALVLIHIGWGLFRVPRKVVGGRLDDIAGYRQQGEVERLFEANDLDGAATVSWVREQAAPDSVVLWSGSELGTMEFAAAFLWPRLVVDARRCGEATTFAGRKIAVATVSGRTGRITLVASQMTVSVEVR